MRNNKLSIEDFNSAIDNGMNILNAALKNFHIPSSKKNVSVDWDEKSNKLIITFFGVGYLQERKML